MNEKEVLFFDPTFGVSQKAIVIANLINADIVEIPEDSSTSFYIKTSPFYNGRENGICISIKNLLSDIEQFNVVFGEHRNSDSIFLDKFAKNTFNNPTLSDFTEEDYKNREMFSPDGYVAVAEKVKDLLNSYIAECVEDYNQSK